MFTVAALALLAAACSSTSETEATAPLEDDITPQEEGTTATPLVVTTDLGPGDVIALTFLLGHPDIDVLAVVVDGGVLIDCEIGVDHVLRLVAAAGTSTVVSCGDVPAVPAGSAAPAALREAAAVLYGLQLPAANTSLLDVRPPFEVIADAVAEIPGEVRILALGPLTHVAAALELGGVAGVIGHVYAHGGLAGPTGGESNFAIDVPAAIAVLESGVPLTLLPADPGSTRIVADTFDELLGSDYSPAGALFAEVAAGITAAPAPALWAEPFAAAIASDESVGTFQMAQVRIEQSGVLIEAAEGDRIRLLREPQADVLAATLRARLGTIEATAPDEQPDAVSATGRLVWQFTLDRGAPFGNKSGSAFDDGVLYIVGFDNRLYAFESESGAVVWDRDLEGSGPGFAEVALSPTAVFIRDVTSSPADEDQASSIAAFDRITGDELWRVGLDEPQGVARNPAYGEGLVVYGATLVGMLGADPATGTTLWTFPVAVADGAGAATVSDGVVYFGARDGVVYALDAASGTEIWRVPTRLSSLGVTSTPAVVDGVVYFGSDSGQVMAVEAASGEVMWETDLSPVQGIPSSPAVGDGKVFLGTLSPTGSGLPAGFFALDAATGAEVWSVLRPEGLVIGSPAFADGVVYVLTSPANALVAFDAETGVQLWSFDLGGSVSDSPVVADGVVYFQANGQVFAVAAPE